MWIKSSGQISDNIFAISTPCSSQLLIVGDRLALVDAGISATSSQLIKEIQVAIGTELALDYLFITHAHFDHVGGIPALRSQYPDLEICSLSNTKDLLEDTEFVENLYNQDVACSKAFKVEPVHSLEDWKKALTIDFVVGDGDLVDLGRGVNVQAVATPGHTKDSTCYYIKTDSVLAGGEALGGYHGRDLYSCCFSEGYTDYIKSLDKLATLHVNSICFPHQGVLSGKLAVAYFIQARQKAERLHNEIKERLASGELVDEITSSILADGEFMVNASEGPFLKAVKESLRGMVASVASATSSASSAE